MMLDARTIIHSAADWRGPDIAARADWIHRFTDVEIDEVERALRSLQARGIAIGQMRREDFPLEKLAATLLDARERLETGPGLHLLRGFPVARYSRDELRLIYWGMCLHIGTAMSQSIAGDVIGDVRNLNVDVNSAAGRAYTSKQRLTFHSDQADVVGLWVMQTARAGGVSMIASALAVRNEILRRRPDLLDVIYQPFYWSWQQQEPPGSPPWYVQPVYSEQDGHFASCYIRTHIRSAQRFPQVPRLGAAQEEALDLLDSLAGSEAFHFATLFEPGDLQLLNNHVILHSRTAFEDWPETERRRHLLRIWLSVPNSRPLNASMTPIFRDTRAGAVRGGFPSRSGKLVHETPGFAG